MACTDCINVSEETKNFFTTMRRKYYKASKFCTFKSYVMLMIEIDESLINEMFNFLFTDSTVTVEINSTNKSDSVYVKTIK